MKNTSTNDRSWIGGVILIAIGLALLAAQVFEPAGWMVLGALSALFLVLYVSTRTYGFLVPGAILGGLAVGVGLEEAGYGYDGATVVLGLACGFLAIYVVNALAARPASWWPLIPGGILAVVGGTQLLEGSEAGRQIGQWWPLALIVVGVIVLLGNMRQRSQGNTNLAAKI